MPNVRYSAKCSPKSFQVKVFFRWPLVLSGTEQTPKSFKWKLFFFNDHAFIRQLSDMDLNKRQKYSSKNYSFRWPRFFFNQVWYRTNTQQVSSESEFFNDYRFICQLSGRVLNKLQKRSVKVVLLDNHAFYQVLNKYRKLSSESEFCQWPHDYTPVVRYGMEHSPKTLQGKV
jgi:hypothetical protein